MRRLGRVLTLIAGLAVGPIAGSGSLTSYQLAQLINPAPDCTQATIAGLCYCGTAPCGYWLRMYVPSVFAETVVLPGDTLLSAPNFAALVDRSAAPATGSASLSTTDNTAEAHLWTLSDGLVKMSRLPPCIVCKPSDSRVPSASASSSSSGSSPCDPSGQIASKLLGQVNNTDIPYLPTLAYATELDAVNWHTGCRDTSLANLLVGNGFSCTAAGVAQWLGGDSALSRLVGADSCIGLWGPLYPRQMRDIGNNPVVHSVKTAYRALSIARDQLGVLPVPVDLGGRMQQAYPAVSACFGIGTLPLPEVGLSAQPTRASADGHYGWFYWRQVACCIRFDAYQQCLQQSR